MAYERVSKARRGLLFYVCVCLARGESDAALGRCVLAAESKKSEVFRGAAMFPWSFEHQDKAVLSAQLCCCCANAFMVKNEN